MVEILVLFGLAVALLVTVSIAVLGALIGLIVLPIKVVGAALSGTLELLLFPFKLLLGLVLGTFILAMGGCLLLFVC